MCNFSIVTGPKYSLDFGIKSDASSYPISFIHQNLTIKLILVKIKILVR